MTIYLTRHGQTEWNLAGRMQGRKNSSLTSLGEQQAEWLGERLADVPFSKIISSSSGRTKQTAEKIRGNRKLDIIEKDEWREIHLGDWEGQLKEEIQAQDGDSFRRFWEEPHTYITERGESFEELMNRVGNEIEKLASTKSPVLVVTHAVVLKGLLAYFHKKSLEDFWTGAFMHATALTIVEKRGDAWNVILEGDTSHHKEVSG